MDLTFAVSFFDVFFSPLEMMVLPVSKHLNAIVVSFT